MLPFGSITSVVPLVVLGFAYLVYLGAILLNKPPVSEFSGPEATINIIEPDTAEDIARQIPDFRSFTDNNSDGLSAVEENITDWSHFLSFIAEIPPSRPLILHHVSQFLPRPPPLC